MYSSYILKAFLKRRQNYSLKGFRRVFVKSGESKSIELEIPIEAFADIDETATALFTAESMKYSAVFHSRIQLVICCQEKKRRRWKL